MKRKGARLGTPEKADRNARIIHQCEVRNRSQSAVAREYHITHQRVHAIIARARKRLREAAEKEGVSK